jgi:hypothetical protein
MTRTSDDVRSALTPFEFNGKRASWAALARHLPDIETALFFGKAVNMPWKKLNELIQGLFKSDVLAALTEGGHSTSLQDYIVSIAPEDVQKIVARADFKQEQPHAEILPHMWDLVQIGVAKSIAEVAGKLSSVLDSLPGNTGEMTFATLMQMNRRRPTIGDYKARITHPHLGKNLVVFDVSGSVNESTVTRIAGDVVALAMKANAGLCLVSDTAKYWDPGTYSVADVLREAEYNGTHYEKLAPLFNQDWDAVIAVADYDSSSSAGRWVREHSTGSIAKLIDISLVGKPTYLSEVLGQLAHEIEPMLISADGVIPRW